MLECLEQKIALRTSAAIHGYTSFVGRERQLTREGSKLAFGGQHVGTKHRPMLRTVRVSSGEGDFLAF